MGDDLTASVLAAEKRRSDAMLANDAAALAHVLDDSLYFSHATGAVDDKAAYLAKMASGRVTYSGITWSEERVIPMGHDAALLTGRMLTAVRVEGIEKQLDNRVISAWSRVSDVWRMVAFQSTPMQS